MFFDRSSTVTDTLIPGNDPAIEGADRRFIVSVIVIAALARLFHLGGQSLWVDELLTLIVATPKPGYPITTLLIHNIHGPLHAFTIYLFRMVSENDFWLRLPSALAGTASVWFLYAWVKEWLGVRYARVAAVLLAVNPLHIHYSQEMRNYAYVFLFAVMSGWCLERLLQHWSRRRALWYALCVAAAALSNFTAAFVFAAHTAVWFLRGRVSRTTVVRWLWVCMIVLVLISPWVYRVYRIIDVSDLVTPVLPGDLATEERLRGDTTVALEAFPFAFYTFGVGFTLGPSLRELHGAPKPREALSGHAPVIAWVAFLFGLLSIAGAIRVWRRRMRPAEIAIYLLFPLIGTFLLNWQNAKVFNVRYVLLALPAWLILIAAGLDSLRPRLRSAAALALVVTTMASLGNYYFNGAYAKEDVRAAVRYVVERRETLECMFAPTVWHVVNKYDRENAPVHYVFRRSWLPMERVDAQLDALFAACNTFWYVRAREWVDDPDGYTLQTIQSRCRQLEVQEFDGVTLFHFEVENQPSDRP